MHTCDKHISHLSDAHVGAMAAVASMHSTTRVSAGSTGSACCGTDDCRGACCGGAEAMPSPAADGGSAGYQMGCRSITSLAAT